MNTAMKKVFHDCKDCTSVRISVFFIPNFLAMTTYRVRYNLPWLISYIINFLQSPFSSSGAKICTLGSLLSLWKVCLWMCKIKKKKMKLKSWTIVMTSVFIPHFSSSSSLQSSTYGGILPLNCPRSPLQMFSVFSEMLDWVQDLVGPYTDIQGIAPNVNPFSWLCTSLPCRKVNLWLIFMAWAL